MARESIGKVGQIPQFADEAEAAAFWDVHSPEDYPDDFEEVDVTFERPLVRRVLTLELSKEEAAKLRQCAAEHGVAPSTLVRTWVTERLQHAQ